MGTQTEDSNLPSHRFAGSIPTPANVSSNQWFLKYYQNAKRWINQQENKGLKLSLIIMTGMVFAMFWYLLMQVRIYNSIIIVE